MIAPLLSSARRETTPTPALRIPALLVACALVGLLAPSPARAAHSFRIHIDDTTEIVREVQVFEVIEVRDGHALFRLDPYPRELDGALLQLGEKKALGEVPLPGEAIWLAYEASSKLGVARLTSTQSTADIPAGATVLSIRPDPNRIAPVDGTIEAARALRRFEHPAAAAALLEHYAGLAEFKPQQCRLLGELFETLTPKAPDGDQPLPETGETTLRTLLAECTGAAIEGPVQRYVQWTLARLEAQKTAGMGFEAQKRLLRNARELLRDQPATDRLLVALARVLEREGDAEEGSMVLEDFFRRFPASPHRDEARSLQEYLARRAPARSHRNVGPLGPAKVTAALGLRALTDMAFDPQGRLLLLDARSNPRQIVVLDPETAPITPEHTVTISQRWNPVALGVGTDRRVHLLESRGDQLVSITESNTPGSESVYPQRGDDWRLRNPQRLGIVGDSLALVLDTSSRQVFRFDLDRQEMTGAINLRALDLSNALDLAAAPDGQVALATPDSFVVFDPAGNPGSPRRVMRGHTVQLRINRLGLDRWKYVYVFDRDNNRLEKFRRGGEWLTTVVDCEKEGIRRPGLWAVSPEGDIVLHDEGTDRLLRFVQ